MNIYPAPNIIFCEKMKNVQNLFGFALFQLEWLKLPPPLGWKRLTFLWEVGTNWGGVSTQRSALLSASHRYLDPVCFAAVPVGAIAFCC